MIPLVSIIIPVFNSELYITETIYSALDQTYKNIEIIIVDDGSTDNSLAIAKQFENEKLKVYSKKNKGAAAARNYGLKKAKGDYIQFLDADDLLAQNKIEIQLKQLINYPNHISFCNTKAFKYNTQQEYLVAYNLPDKIKTETDPYSFLVNLYGGYGNPGMVTVHAWLTPKTVIDAAGTWNENLSVDDDGEFFCRLVLKAKSVIFCDETYVFYRKYESGNNLSAQKSFSHYESELKSIQLKEGKLLTQKDTLEARKAMSFWYMRLAIVCYPQYKKISDKALLEIKKLGVTAQIPIMGGKTIEFLKKIFGWKFVRTLSYLKHR